MVQFEESSGSHSDGEHFVSWTFGVLTLQVDGDRVLEVQYSDKSENEDYWIGSDRWEVADIKAFIEGDWIKDLQDLNTAIRDLGEKVNREDYEKRIKREAEDLKQRFGLKDSDAQ